MNFLIVNIFYVIPFMIILYSLALSIKNVRAKKVLVTISSSILFVYIFLLIGIVLVLPYLILFNVFKNGVGIILMVCITITVWVIISLYIYVRNIYIINKNNIKEIYIRDIDVEYSPAVLSYLINNKIETGKDLSATLLNLCTKNILKIQKLEGGKISIIDLKNTKEVSKLNSDEKYAYKMLVEGVTNSKISCWKNKVEEEYAKHKFSKEHEVTLGIYLLIISGIIFAGIIFYFCITGKSEISGIPAIIFGSTTIVTFLGGWEMMILLGVKNFLKAIIKRSEKYEFKDTYTKKGAKEYSRWKNFERFIEGYSLIDEREYESGIIWGEYLSYSIALGINKKCDNELYNKIEKEYSFNYDLLSRIFEYE